MDAEQAGPDVRPLGWMALALALVSGLLAASIFLSILAVPVAGVALFLGLGARGVEKTRSLGTIAVVVAALALVWGAVVFLSVVFQPSFW